jgi:hypothetical protein
VKEFGIARQICGEKEQMQHKNLNLTIVAFLSITAIGCAASMAKIRSTYKDTSILQIGADRSAVIEKLGPADASANLAQGGYIDIYRIDPNAHSDEAKRAATVSHTILSVMTYGLWEFIGTPLELAAKDRFFTYVLTYDGTEKLAQLQTVKVWNPPTITDGDRKKCEQFAAFQAMDMSVPPEIPGNAISALESSSPPIRHASKYTTV